MQALKASGAYYIAERIFRPAKEERRPLFRLRKAEKESQGISEDQTEC